MRKVTVEHLFQGGVDGEFPDVGVLYEEQGIVLVVDPYGLIEIYTAHQHPTKGEGYVAIDPQEENLNSDNPEYVVDLILSGGMK
ncbi:hypothetical protein [Bacillus sp. AFS041924]|uniref:hypothetical protein n=1 Tax=Bacillus sp. AFS041924 TaxID=2033503 RepID=UPI000BFC6C2D|nr:hypothetical protein [Bacillus sp. AFS041924]PGS55106.1 hypothetical protein COC46_04060 [Bacillus sp. AFS041924]